LDVQWKMASQDDYVSSSLPLYGISNFLDNQTISSTQSATFCNLSPVGCASLQQIGTAYSTELLLFPLASRSLFEYSVPVQQEMRQIFNATDIKARLTLIYEFTRPGPSTFRTLRWPPQGDDDAGPLLTDADVHNLRRTIDDVMGAQCNEANTTVRAASFKTTQNNGVFAIQFPSDSTATQGSVDIAGFKPSDDPDHPENKLDLKFTLQRQWNAESKVCDSWWSVGVADSPLAPSELFVGIASQKQLPTLFAYLQGLGLIGVYTVVVLAVGRAIRPVFSGQAAQVMFIKMEDVTIPYQLVRDIYLARADGELMVEELSYHELIDLYRDPHKLAECTTDRKKHPNTVPKIKSD